MPLSIFSGQVISGHGRGRTIGFPTLNLRLDLEMDTKNKIPFAGKNAKKAHSASLRECASGVYVVKAQVNGTFFYGGMHFGPRPTFDEKESTVEIHLVGFSGEKVDGEVRVEVLKRIRGIRTFVSQEALKKQIEKDMMAIMKMAHDQ